MKKSVNKANWNIQWEVRAGKEVNPKPAVPEDTEATSKEDKPITPKRKFRKGTINER